MSKLKINIDNKIYYNEFHQIQIEITGRCNMNCEHCRAKDELKEDMPLKQIDKILKFANIYSNENKKLVISGGEPLMHRKIFEVLKQIKKNNFNKIILTTNASLLKKIHLDYINDLNFDYFIFLISLDDLSAKKHNKFRNHSGSFDLAINAIDLINKTNIPNCFISLRTALKPWQISEMENFVNKSIKLNCSGILFSSIHPIGKAKNKSNLLMDKKNKKKYIHALYSLANKYPNYHITSCEPLLCLPKKYSENKNKTNIKKFCDAAIHQINFSANGNMTPCVVLNLPILNTFNKNIDSIVSGYENNEIVKNLISRNFEGKCKTCKNKFICGGCRGDAFEMTGNYLAEDPNCWI